MVDKVLNAASKYVGVMQGSSVHQGLIDQYNKIKPLPVGYEVKYADDWCDAFITVVGDETGASHLIGRECGVQRHINIFRDKNIWLGKVAPQVGDIVTFDWDGAGWADHIGFVEKVEGNMITTIEGNSSSRVARNNFKWHDRRIKGYARPQYEEVTRPVVSQKSSEQVAREIVAGKGNWGNGGARKITLEANGYNYKAVQKQVNAIMSQASHGKVKASATHWQTGQPIASWVNGGTFDIADQRKIGNRTSYLLMRGITVLGWMWGHDLELG